MSDQLERFHATLALQSAAVGLLVAALIAIVARLGHRAPGAVPHVVIAAMATIASLGAWGAIEPRWSALLLVLVACSVADRRPDESASGAMAVISLVGVWSAVPDTETPLVAAAIVTVVVGVATAVSGGSGPSWRRSDRLAAIVLVVVAAVVGSAGRSEVVGGIGCVGLLVTALDRVRPSPRRELGRRTALGLHIVVVVTSARVLTRCTVPVAIAGVVVLLTVALFAGRRVGTVPPAADRGV